MKRASSGAILLCLLLQFASQRAPAEPPLSSASYTHHHELPALELANDLVSTLTLPDLGGRTMRYDLGGRNLLYENPAEAGKLYPPETRRTRWIDYGGAKALPGPRSAWSRPWPPDPLTDSERWLGEVTVPAGQIASLRLLSPLDARRLRITRTLSLSRGSSRLLLEHRLENLGSRPQECSLVEWTQLAPQPASSGLPEADRPSADRPGLEILLPVGPGDYELKLAEGQQAQPDLTESAGLLRLRWRGEGLQLAAKARAGWILSRDPASGCVFVKRFRYLPALPYPEGGVSVQLIARRGEPYLALLVLGPLVRLAPAETSLFTEEWLSAYLPPTAAPTAVTDLGLVAAALRARRLGPRLLVTGSFGSFFVGRAELRLFDASGQTLGQPVRLPSPLSPLEPLAVNLALEAPPRAASVRLLAFDPDDSPLGELARAKVE
jgi:hypothetical protein